MKIYIAIAAILFSMVLAHVANAQGEIGPHYRKDKFAYAGNVYGNEVYILSDDQGNFGTKSAEGVVHADVWTAREDFYIMYKHPKQDLFAIVDSLDPKFGKKEFSDLEFSEFPAESMPRGAWARAQSPKTYEPDTKKGREFSWIYVGVQGGREQSDRFYVRPLIQPDPKTGCLFVTVMIVQEQRLAVSVDASKRKFHTQSMDILAMPVGEEKIHEMKSGDLSQLVLQFMSRKK
jgi:hypothetical protein